jgi:hypothetical protein
MTLRKLLKAIHRSSRHLLRVSHIVPSFLIFPTKKLISLFITTAVKYTLQADGFLLSQNLCFFIF